MAARIAYNMKDEVSAEAALQMITKRDPSSSRSPKPADSATPIRKPGPTARQSYAEW